jgi:hypothetical protein
MLRWILYILPEALTIEKPTSVIRWKKILREILVGINRFVFWGKLYLSILGGWCHTYQDPFIGKNADPYSTLVFSPHDPYIPAATYPNTGLSRGQEREVTVLQTGKSAYPWVVLPLILWNQLKRKIGFCLWLLVQIDAIEAIKTWLINRLF